MIDDRHNNPGDPIAIEVPDQDNKIQIDKEFFEAPLPRMTGRELGACRQEAC